jgi:S1-C subfamily serine protease
VADGSYSHGFKTISGVGWYSDGELTLDDCGLGRHRLEVRAEGFVPRHLEIEISPGQKSVEQVVRLVRPNAVRVVSVTPGGAAHRTGVAAGDVIRSYRGDAVTSVAALARATGSTSPGEWVSVVLERDGARLTLLVPGGRLDLEGEDFRTR